MKIKGSLCLIGGVKKSDSETINIDKLTFSKTKKKKINILLIDFAYSLGEKGDKYLNRLQEQYRKIKGFAINIVRLDYEQCKISNQYRKTLMETADVLYFGGGNPQQLYNAIQELGLKKYITNIVGDATKAIIGKSAGALIFFEYFIYQASEETECILSKGLGYVKGIGCAHFSEKKRQKILMNFCKKLKKKGIGIDENCGLLISGADEIILSSTKKKSVWIYEFDENKVMRLKNRKEECYYQKV